MTPRPPLVWDIAPANDDDSQACHSHVPNGYSPDGRGRNHMTLTVKGKGLLVVGAGRGAGRRGRRDERGRGIYCVCGKG